MGYQRRVHGCYARVDSHAGTTRRIAFACALGIGAAGFRAYLRFASRLAANQTPRLAQVVQCRVVMPYKVPPPKPMHAPSVPADAMFNGHAIALPRPPMSLVAPETALQCDAASDESTAQGAGAHVLAIPLSRSFGRARRVGSARRPTHLRHASM